MLGEIAVSVGEGMRGHLDTANKIPSAGKIGTRFIGFSWT